MFANVGWGEILVLIVVGLVVLGPERLPGAIRWTSTSLRQARDYLSGMTTQLREDMGPEFDNLREPLSELQKLRGMTPRAALTKHLLDGDDSLFRSFEQPPMTPLAPEAPAPQPMMTPQKIQPAAGPAPFDTDAT
ncbi:Sec-independent protein translocase protein TatB [Candidatus Mycobacterium wuenschmannii]|uniref:Sec-independent protein translocase protein TatB n=1 Tax=Candidatus Mycobacterium wuenschmannii TaxID=3027808 RepID=A0ABY8W4C4_9MYCO|nr:Sec-independent protein translocase protein TatB [Candidatus Mycobacterium wuenschmannii]WIM89892.1 Sec-independent protein translocase protein TatB [Candidatus Mycobacterium wuenschmannii]